MELLLQPVHVVDLEDSQKHIFPIERERRLRKLLKRLGFVVMGDLYEPFFRCALGIFPGGNRSIVDFELTDHLVHHRDHILLRHRQLEDIVRYAERHGLLDHAELFQTAQNDDPGAFVPFADFGYQFNPGHDRHFDVGQHNIRVLLLIQLPGRLPVLRISGDLHAQLFPLDGHADPHAYEHLILHDDGLVQIPSPLPLKTTAIPRAAEHGAYSYSV